MAKKNCKPNLPQSTLERARREMYGSAPVTVEILQQAPDQMSAPVAARPVMRRTVDLREEYAYVLSDLQNMGILAAVLMVVLVIMSFFI